MLQLVKNAEGGNLYDERLSSAEVSRVLVVDDMRTNRELVKLALQKLAVEVVEAGNGTEALEKIDEQEFDLILLDVVMPGMDGFEVCRRIRENRKHSLLSIVMLTTEDGVDAIVKGMEVGATEYLRKPFHPEELKAHVRSAIRNKRITDNLDEAETVLFALARMVEAKDKCTGSHCDRLMHMGVVFGEHLGLDFLDIDALRRGGVLHDIGKLGIPDSILLKPGKLDEQEWALMKQHTNIGAELCGSLKSMRRTQCIIRYHHEKYNGSGYPDGLGGNEIPLLARIFQIIDVYDALTSKRPYKPALPLKEVVAIMEKETALGYWDPVYMDAFLGIVHDSPRVLSLPKNNRADKSANILTKIQGTGVLDWLDDAKIVTSPRTCK